MPYKDRQTQLQYWNDYQKKHRKRSSQNCLNSYYNLKKQVFELLGNKCACCGTQDDLTVDHIQNRDPAYQPHNPWPNYREVRDHSNPTQYFQILCRRCNRSKADTICCRLKH